MVSMSSLHKFINMPLNWERGTWLGHIKHYNSYILNSIWFWLCLNDGCQGNVEKTQNLQMSMKCQSWLSISKGNKEDKLALKNRFSLLLFSYTSQRRISLFLAFSWYQGRLKFSQECAFVRRNQKQKTTSSVASHFYYTEVISSGKLPLILQSKWLKARLVNQSSHVLSKNWWKRGVHILTFLKL